jgi:pimeloyl-ACP methyl ester carboxylesterase
MSAADPEIVLAVLEAKQANEPAVLAGLDEIDIPVVSISPDFKPVDQASFAAYHVDVIMITGVGHFAMMEDPGAFNTHLAEAVERISGRL